MPRDMGLEVPPQKRRRISMIDKPDGFTTSKATAPVRVKAQKFVSQFEKSSSSNEESASKPISGSKPASKTTMPISKPPLSLKPLSTSQLPNPRIASKPLRFKPPSTPDLKLRAQPSYDISQLNQKSKSAGRLLEDENDHDSNMTPSRIRPLPSFALPGNTHNRPTTTLPAPHSGYKNDSDSSTAHPRMRPPPSFALPHNTSAKPTTTLNSIPPPRLPNVESIEPMFPISKTTIALATDLTTDNGTAELASIFLRDQHPDISNNLHDTDHVNGVYMGVSPEKGGKFSKGKGKERFIRNGLAAHASNLFSRSNTSLILWQKEMEINLSSRSVPPDLRARIIKVIDVPHGAGSRSPFKASSSATLPPTSPGLALCQIISVSSRKQSRYAHPLPHGKGELHHLVVLSFPSVAPTPIHHNNQIHVRNPEDFVEGRELHVWEPWQEVSLSNNAPVSAKEIDTPGLPIAPFPLLPSSFPFSASPVRTPTTNADAHIANTVLLCSRFLIKR